MAEASAVNLAINVGGWRTGSIESPTPIPAVTTVTLRQTKLGAAPAARSFPVTHDNRDDAYSASTDGVETHSVQLTTGSELLETIIDTELYTDEERELYNGADFCPYPLILDVAEITADAPIPELVPLTECTDVRPTYREICQRVADHIGFGLVVYDGPGLPFNDRKVDPDYTTKGKTAQTVLSETLLVTEPRWWGDDNTVHIDGRVLQSGALPALHFTSLDRRTVRATEIEPPTLPTDDPCDDLFETSDTYTLTWPEATGEHEDFSRIETTYTIEKVDGQVVSETEERKGYFHYLSGEKPFDVYYRMTRTYDYVTGCRGAMTYMCENVYQAPLEMTYWDVPVLEDPDVRNRIFQIKDFLPTLFNTSCKEVFQRWHAEGWLFSRHEIGLEAAAFAKNLDGSPVFGYVPYKRTERSETYIPIGNGIWRVAVTEKFPSEIPVYEQDADFVYTATYPIATVNFYVQETDQSPPTVTCNPPCGPQTPEAEAQEQYDFEVAKRNAILAMQPDAIIDTVTVNGLLLSYDVGQFRGAAFVSAVSYDISHESGAATTTVEFMRAAV